MEPVAVSLEEMYDGSQERYEAFLAKLDESLNPRPPDVLYYRSSPISVQHQKASFWMPAAVMLSRLAKSIVRSGVASKESIW